MWKVDDETMLDFSAAKSAAFLMGRAWRWRFPARIVAADGRWRRACLILAAGSRWRRACLILALILCSPVLVPLVCLFFPLLCIAALCLRRRKQQPPPEPGDSAADAAFLGRCEEGAEAMAEAMAEGERDVVVLDGRLLQRYLEDQLGLVGAMLDSDDSVADGC